METKKTQRVQLNLRISPELDAAVADYAQRHGLSINGLGIRALEMYISHESVPTMRISHTG